MGRFDSDFAVAVAPLARVGERRRRLDAIATGQLSRSYPDQQWLVAVSVCQEENSGPFRAQLMNLALVFPHTML